VNVDHAGADALNSAVAGIALLGGAEEQGAALVHPDVAIAAAAEGPSMLPLRRTLETPAGTVSRDGLPADQKASVS